MLSNLRVYSCGNTYKYIGLPVLTNKMKEYYVNNDIKYKTNNNLIRAKTKIKDLILCNNFKYFITITIKSKYDRFDLSKIRKLVNQRIRHLRTGTDKKFHFLFVPERHKNGAWHLHGVLDQDFSSFICQNDFMFFECTIFNSLGYNSVSKIRDNDRVSSYITKYICKDLDKTKFNHMYFCSQKLNRPQLVCNILYNNQYFDHTFFVLKSDFCNIRYDKIYYNNITKLLQLP